MPKANEQAEITRLAVITFARDELQRFLSVETSRDWLEASAGFLEGVNATLKFHGFEETDLEHLLPSFSSDASLITYAEVAHNRT